MPVIKCSNGKYRIGNSQCMYHSKEKAERAYNAYLAKSHMNEDLDGMDIISMDVPLFIRMLEFAKEDAKTDMDLHTATENILDLLIDNKTLSMDNYNDIVGEIKMSEDNVMKQCNEALKLLESDTSEVYGGPSDVEVEQAVKDLNTAYDNAFKLLQICNMRRNKYMDKAWRDGDDSEFQKLQHPVDILSSALDREDETEAVRDLLEPYRHSNI